MGNLNGAARLIVARKIKDFVKGRSFTTAKEFTDWWFELVPPESAVSTVRFHAETPVGAVFLAELGDAGFFGEPAREALLVA